MGNITGIKIMQYTKSVYCTCGGKATFVGSDLRGAIKLWSEAHQGDGHAPCTRAQCAQARKRLEEQQERKRILERQAELMQ